MKKMKLAAALKYAQGEDDAPVVVAAGKGITAINIVQKALEEGVPVHEDADLAQILSSIEVGKEIPQELYLAVAEILAFVWKLDKKYYSAGDKRDES
ncbi:MAG: EscU/YscU/HrcU family type III secretion system export apparatus switch protein [Bacillota bacterium]